MNDRHPAISVVRRLKASPEKVYAAITQVDHVLRWWGPEAGPAVSAKIDLRPGGRYSVVFRLLDGSEHNPTGVYREVVPNEKLVFTWEWPNRPDWESLVTIRLRPIDIGTELTLTHERLPNDDAVKSHRAGWSGWVGELETYVENEL